MTAFDAVFEIFSMISLGSIGLLIGLSIAFVMLGIYIEVKENIQ